MSRPRTRIARAATLLGLILLWCDSSRSPALSGEHDAIPWRADFERAQAEAQVRGLPLWVHFTGPWCVYCRQMEATTFVDRGVIDSAAEGFIPVQVRADHRDDLMQRYGVTGLPAAVIVAPGGEILSNVQGYVDPAGFLAFLGTARGRFRPESSPALGGHCPVGFVRNGALTLGKPEFSAEYDGRVFRFADADSRRAFLREPERYLPSNGGRCVVRKVDRGEPVAGDPRFGVYYRGRLYLCSDEESRARFAKEPGRYADADLGLDGYCPHCREAAGNLVRGLPKYPSTYDGRRYLFPDEEHRAAFRSSPEKFLR